ncbi:Glucosamine-phosphate N-acetyltransferase-like protein [Tilletia horrida]|uniref:Glucosamine 6-phosphate N-acetyltransferase n=1 Tax=Tilletia horrida TaxID=155126 RepID=A0AAN6GN96_9BASI|nr:Glucosamine-phosphate N-acetyltransferase-like protein [Tilletia horrida]KAK0568601.1 Glucosamine-phosphate N-acetyltransferase-like protein [Tilletia horrida]
MPFTPDSELDLAFEPSLIPASVHELVGSTLALRPLASTDYSRGHLKVLTILTTTPDVGEQAWAERFQALKKIPDTYYPIVLVDRETDQLVAVGTLVIEFKFIRGLGKAGHIEDIAVDPTVQGKGLGKKIIAALTAISEGLGAYKVFLDCSTENQPFYEKCGYKLVGVQMAKYAPGAAKKQ